MISEANISPLAKFSPLRGSQSPLWGHVAVITPPYSKGLQDEEGGFTVAESKICTPDGFRDKTFLKRS